MTHKLSDSLLDSLVNIAIENKDRADESVIDPKVNWRETRNPVSAAGVAG